MPHCNRLNSQATIEQTSGCLIVLYYNNSSGKEFISILPRKLI
jgi:hypothetical protein